MIIILGLACYFRLYAENYELKIEVPQSVCTSDTLWENVRLQTIEIKSAMI